MDHHDWQDWPEEHGDPGDTADLTGHDDLGTGGADPGGLHGEFDDYPADHDAYDAGEPYPPAEPGPDLLHDGVLHDGVPDDGVGGEHVDGEPAGWQPPDADAHPDADRADDPPYDPVEADHPAFGDPDLTADPDPGWHASDFPPELDLGHPPPEPLDGYPWSDPDTLGTGYADTGGLDYDAFADHAAPPSDLFAYSGMEQPPGGNPWSALMLSDDPATSSLARWWGAAA